MKTEVLLFGQLAEMAGKNKIEVEGATDTEELKNHISRDFPSLKNLKFVVAVSMQVTHENKHLTGGEVVALLPPFAGG